MSSPLRLERESCRLGPIKLVRWLRMRLIAVPFPVFACFVALQACSNLPGRLSSQQVAAYSAAIGFLGLCDDGDFNGALILYGGPIKARAEAATWVTQMQSKRGPVGLPIIRSWVNRQGLNGPPNITFQFRTSFSSGSLLDEVVSVTRTSGHWQVYGYNFHVLGKHPPSSTIPTANPKVPRPAQSPFVPPLPPESPGPTPYPFEPRLPTTTP
jgi:Protein of unknown function (DUF4019)